MDAHKTSVLYECAWRLVGKPYIWGGDDPILGFDCSGLVIELLTTVGMWEPKKDATAQQLYYHFEQFGQIGKSEFGSLVFYGKDLNLITHVAMIIEPGFIIEAGSGGSKTKTVQDAIDQNAYVRVRPIENRKKEIQAIILPHY